MQPSVILVDQNDRPLGTESKQLAHTSPLLHRAFSILLFRSDGQLILQRRAAGKYHSAGLWSNTCCSHPAPNAHLPAYAVERLQQEMGLTADLEKIGTLRYELQLADNLFEYEFNHLFCGTSDEPVNPDPTEVSDWQTLSLDQVAEAITKRPTEFTAWFPLILDHLQQPLRHYLQSRPADK
jgi:isopentenyl-diphosphate delta-isomerase